MLDRSLALRLNGPWATSGEDSPFHTGKCTDGARAVEAARALFLSNMAEERAELLWDRRGVDLISDALPFGRLSYGGPSAISNAVGYAVYYSRLHDALIRVFDAAGNAIDTHEHKGGLKEW